MKYIIRGGMPLSGTVNIPAAKNALLPMIAASIMAEGQTTLRNCPTLKDVSLMLEIIGSLGGFARQKSDEIRISGAGINAQEVECDMARKMRSSIFYLGPLLAVRKKATIYYPGGCRIGARPIDIHITGFRALGVDIRQEEQCLIADAAEAHSGNVYLRYPSVGATENLVMLACKLQGKTMIYNAAREPEVVDLCDFINKMGGNVKGQGSDVLEIVGVDRLRGVDYAPIGDRISAGTYAAGTLLCGGELELRGKFGNNLTNFFGKISDTYCNIIQNDDIIRIYADGRVRVSDYVSTGAYPEFATDLQPIMGVLMANGMGDHLLVENVFEDRFGYLDELKKAGCYFRLFGRAALITGGRLDPCDYVCPDLRAGAALMLAALASNGVSTLSDPGFIDRGYEDLRGGFNSLGADIAIT